LLKTNILVEKHDQFFFSLLDAMTVIAFLKTYNLDKHFKVSAFALAVTLGSLRLFHQFFMHSTYSFGYFKKHKLDVIDAE